MERRRESRASIKESSSTSGSAKKFRSSRAVSKEERNSDLMWMDLLREQEDKKTKSKEMLEEKRLLFQEKQAADAKEIRMKELDLERMRFEIESEKWDVLLFKLGTGNASTR